MTAPQAMTLNDVVRLTGGVLQTGPFGSQLHASDYVTEGTPLVMPINLGDNVIREEGIARIGDEDVKRLSRHQLRPGDIVFGRRGDIGRRSIVREEQTGWLCGTGCLAVKFGKNLDQVNPEYVSMYVGGRDPQSWLAENAVGGTMPNLNTSILGLLPILLPTRDEQDAVVRALNDVSSFERYLQRSILKKRDIKQGMMQELLTGRTRISGFTDDWRKFQWSEVTVHRPGNGQIKGYLSALETERNRYTGFSASGQDVWLPTYDFRGEGVVVSAVGSRCGKAFFARGEWSAIANTHVVLPRGGLLDARFSFLHFNNEDFWIKGGSGQPFVQIKASLRRSVLLPPVEEQRSIASVLEDVDAEIEGLERRLESTRAIRQGMMQELLTGRTRLPVAEGVSS